MTDNWWQSAPLAPASDPSFTGYIPGVPKPPAPKEPKTSWKPLTPAEASAAGLDTGKVWQRSSEGEVKPVGTGEADPEKDILKSAIDNIGIDELLNNVKKARALAQTGWATGIAGAAGTVMPGSTANDFRAQLEAIQGGIILEKMKALKDASKNGASGLGSLSEKEGERLAASVAALNPHMSQSAILSSLDEIANHAQTLQAVRDGKDPHDPAVMKEYGITTNTPTGAGGGGPAGGTTPGGPGGDRKNLSAEQQNEFFRILQSKGAEAGNAYLQQFGLAMKDPSAANRPFSKALEYVVNSAPVQSFNDIAGGIIKGAAALPDALAKGVGNVLAAPVDALGYGDAANALRHPFQIGESVDRQIPVSGQPLGALNRFGGELVGGVVGFPAKAAGALSEFIVGRGSREAGRVPSALAGITERGGPTIQEAAGRQNVRLLPADVGGDTVKGFTSGAAQAPLSRAPIVAAARQGQRDLQAATDRAIGGTGGRVLPADDAGDAVRRGGTEWIRQSTDRASRWYDRANELADNIKLMPKTAVEALDRHIAEYEQAGEVGKPMVEELNRVRSTLDQTGGITITGLRKARTLLGAMARNDKLRGTDAGRIFGEVLDAASSDMAGALRASGKEQAANMFQRADTLWKERIQHIDEVLEPIIGKGRSGEDIMRNFEAMAQGSRGGALRLQRVLDTMPKDEKADVVATIIDRGGRAKPNAQDDVGSVFSSETFLTNWNLWSAKAKRAMFGNGELRQNLDDIAKLAAAKRGTNAIASKSNTPIGIATNTGVIGGIAIAHPGIAATAAALQYSTGRLLASPLYTRWLARMPKTAAGIDRHIGRLPYIARATPAIANDIEAVYQRLNTPVTMPLAAQGQGQQNDQ